MKYNIVNVLMIEFHIISILFRKVYAILHFHYCFHHLTFHTRSWLSTSDLYYSSSSNLISKLVLVGVYTLFTFCVIYESGHTDTITRFSFTVSFIVILDRHSGIGYIISKQALTIKEKKLPLAIRIWTLVDQEGRNLHYN